MEASSEFFGYFDAAHNGNNNNNNNGSNHFVVDDLLDLPKEDDVMTDAFFDSLTGNSADSSTTVTAVDSSNFSDSGGDTTTTTTHFNGNLSSRSFTDAHFSGTELCVPYDDLAELEWLSNFMEDSLSSGDDLQNLQFIPTGKASSAATITDTSSSSITTTNRNNYNNTNSPLPIFSTDVSVPGKARSKRSRAAPCDWSSRLLLVSPTTSSSENHETNPTPINTMITNYSKPAKMTQTKRRENTDTMDRKCLHCGSEKTPQWRTGPMGPKTLCNACGVRYKSGRLVPEYRPAASPTFVSAKHSNSHRKVVELRRQKELQRHQFVGQTSIFGVSNGGDDYLIHHHQQMNGPDYRHMI